MVHPQTLDQALLKKDSSWNGALLSISVYVCGHSVVKSTLMNLLTLRCQEWVLIFI